VCNYKEMKSVIVSGVLLIVMVAFQIIPVIPVIDYLINKDYIAKNLCINKDKPKSCCKGKCHMVKQLQKASQNSEKDTKNTNKRIQIKELNEFIVNSSFHFNLDVRSVSYQKYNILAYSQQAIYSVFVPPKSIPGSF
jgi:hypothetical protein